VGDHAAKGDDFISPARFAINGNFHLLGTPVAYALSLPSGFSLKPSEHCVSALESGCILESVLPALVVASEGGRFVF
jgi:hypothetical protein